jgi:hypothetical protein
MTGTQKAGASPTWSVTCRVALPAGPARQAVREIHHAPFPPVPELLARSVSADVHGVRARYLFASAPAAVAFSADDDAALRRLGPPATSPVRAVPAGSLAAPVIIVSPPRSGSTALFDALARHPDLWTVGGESEGVIEGVPALHPAAGGYATHALGADDARWHDAAVRAGFLADLRDAGGRRWLDHGNPGVAPPRLLEKTPENSLRLPFLLALFPDATVLHLHRDPRDTVASMVRAWHHPGFVNIPELPGWARGAWHLLLPPGWRRWASDDLSQIAARQWAAAVEATLDARRSHPGVRWVDIDYTELRGGPARTLRWLEAALRLPAAAHAQDLPLSATTISPPRPGKWRHTPGFDPAVLHLVTQTHRRLTKERNAMPETDPAIRRPFFACWLDGPGITAPDHHAAAPGTPAADANGTDRDGGSTVLDPAVVLQTGVTIPLPLVRRARFRDRFLPDHPILWTDDPATGALAPFWVRFKDFWALHALAPGAPLPPEFPARLRTALAEAGALSSADARAERAAGADAAVARRAEEFARTDVCRMGRTLHPRHCHALLDYYEQLIATKSWPLGDAQVAGRYGWYNESLSRFFHHQFRTLVGRLAGQPVRPSYSYVSAYRAGAVLDRHVDREQCEYTVSLLLGESGPGIEGGWPLLLDAAHGSIPVIQSPGEAVLFRGTRVPHWRPPLSDGTTHTSLLFHYVPADFRKTLY